MLAITRHERDVLRRELDWYQGALEDLVSCLKFGRSEPRVRWRTHIALALLDDLGWQRENSRGSFYVTLDRGELAHWLRSTLDENDAYIEELRGNLSTSHDDALHEQRYLVAAGRVAPPVAEIARDYRQDTRGKIDEALEFRLVIAALIERLEAQA
jgi:hypothetical protein